MITSRLFRVRHLAFLQCFVRSFHLLFMLLIFSFAHDNVWYDFVHLSDIIFYRVAENLKSRSVVVIKFGYMNN